MSNFSNKKRAVLQKGLPFSAMTRWPFLALIRLYQKTLSPDHGPMKSLHPHGYCRFHPTCSDYTYGSIERFGVVRGIILGTWRVLRCNPWNKGGNDPVPETFSLKVKK